MQQIHGIGLKIGAIALFTVMFALVKALSDTIPAGQAVFFRSAFAIPVLFAWLLMQGELAGAVTVKSKRAHVWRGFVGTAAMGLNFTAAGFLPLPEITAIGFHHTAADCCFRLCDVGGKGGGLQDQRSFGRFDRCSDYR
jgi:drug/metabolite transporter (DMT)-like permease